MRTKRSEKAPTAGSHPEEQYQLATRKNLHLDKPTSHGGWPEGEYDPPVKDRIYGYLKSMGLIQEFVQMTLLEAPEKTEDIFKGAGFAAIAGKKIAIIGDSHVDNIYSFGKELEKGLTDLGAIVKRFGWGGSSARAWLDPVPISGKIRNINEVTGSQPYDILIMCLGTNDSGNFYRGFVETKGREPVLADLEARARTVVSRITELSGKIEATHKIWVGPPSVTGKVKWYKPVAVQAVRNASSGFPGIYIDSTDIPSDEDGVHVSEATSKRWADKVIQKILTLT